MADHVDLGKLELELNEDEGVRSEFMTDPVGLLEKRGLRLSSQMQERLASYIADLQNPVEAASGASIARDGVLISIGKSF